MGLEEHILSSSAPDTDILPIHSAEQLLRQPRDFPKLVWKRNVQDIDDFKSDDFEVQGYKPHGKIDMRMSV